MKILFSHYLLDDDHPAARMVYAIAAGLCAREHEVLVHRSAGGRPGTEGRRLTPSKSARDSRTQRFQSLRSRVWFAKALARNAAMLHRDLRAVASFMPDVVLARQDAYCTSMALAAARFDVPLVTYADAPVAYESRTFGGEWHRWHPPHLVESMESWTLRRSRAVVAVSRPAARRLDGYGLTTPVHVVPNGVDPSRFLPLDESDRAELRRQCGLTAPLVAGFAGTFKSFHGVDRLRELILATAHRRDTQWLLIGDGPDRPALEEALRGTSSVVFLGKRPASEIGRLLSLVDVAVAPHPPMDGDFYFCPLKVLEYAAAGCAVVATHQGDVPEILGHGRAGIVVSGSAIDDWVAAVNRLLDDEELRHALGRAARDRVLTRYTWTRTAERVEAVLLEATGRAEPKPPRCRGRNHLETYGPGDSFDALPTFTPALEAPPLPAQRALPVMPHSESGLRSSLSS